MAYHQVKEAIASNILAYHLIETDDNLSDMLSKHWDHLSVYNMIMKLLITRGPIRLIPQEATQEKSIEVSKLKSKQQTNSCKRGVTGFHQELHPLRLAEL